MRKVICLLSLVISTLALSLLSFVLFIFDRKGEILHEIERLWAKIYLHSAGIKVIVNGTESVKSQPVILMCNHQSALDIFVLLYGLPLSFRFVAKKGLFRIPFMGWAMKCVGHISIDRESPRDSMRALEEAKEKIKRGQSVLIFPEGTRSEDGTLLPFKRGSFHIVSLSRVPVVPVAIYGSSLLMPKGKVLPIKSGTVWIEIGTPILAKGDKVKKAEIMEEVRKQMETLIGKGRMRAYHEH